MERLREFCKSPERLESDIVTVYIASHGEILDDGEHYILTSDVEPADLLNRAIPTSDLVKRLLQGTQIRTALIILDSCFAGQGGRDMVGAALRRISAIPTPIDNDLGREFPRGILLVAATHPLQYALPGEFTQALFRATTSESVGGGASAAIRIGELIDRIKADDQVPRTQMVEWHQLSMDSDEPPLVPNPRFRRELADVDLLQQERLIFAEEQDAFFQTRFLPASRWFTGRVEALSRVVQWINHPSPGASTLIITGAAGSGKTAILGLIAAVTDREYRSAAITPDLPNAASLLPDGSIDIPIYAGTLSTSQIRDRIAERIGTAVQTTRELLDALQRRPISRPLTILIDALDEAADSADLCRRLVGPLMSQGHPKVRLLLGARNHLLTDHYFGRHTQALYELVDLDNTRYADPNGIRSYVERILQSDDALESEYSPSGIYRSAPPETVTSIAQAISDAADKSFLIARIVAMTECTASSLPEPADLTWRASLPRYAGDAMQRDLERRLGPDADRAKSLLLPLAYSQGAGMPWGTIWPKLARALALKDDLGDSDLIWLRRAAGSYVVEGVAAGISVYRLYHQALASHLLDGRVQRTDQAAIAESLIGSVPIGTGHLGRAWHQAHPYIKAHLATHASAAGLLDELVSDPAFLVNAARPQLVSELKTLRHSKALRHARAYRRALPNLRSGSPAEQVSYLQLAAACGQASDLASALNDLRPIGGWSTKWAVWTESIPHKLIAGLGPIRVVDLVDIGGDASIVSIDENGVMRLWDLRTGDILFQPLDTGHSEPIRAATYYDGFELLIAILNRAGDIVICQPFRAVVTPTPIRSAGSPLSLAIFAESGRPVLAVGSDIGDVTIWDLRSGQRLRNYQISQQYGSAKPILGHQGRVTSLEIGSIAGKVIAVSGGFDGAVLAWDLSNGKRAGGPFTGGRTPVGHIAISTVIDRPMALSAGIDNLLRLSSVVTGNPIGTPMSGHFASITATAASERDGITVAASGDESGRIRLWDLNTTEPIGKMLIGHRAPVTALTIGYLDGETLAISGSLDGTIRIWAAIDHGSSQTPSDGHRAQTATSLDVDGVTVLVSASLGGSIQLWDLDTGDSLSRISTLPIQGARCIVGIRLRQCNLVIAGGVNGNLLIQDIRSAEPPKVLRGAHVGAINCLSIGEIRGETLLASGGADGNVRLWRLPDLDEYCPAIYAHRHGVRDVRFSDRRGGPVLISGGADRTVRLYDVETREHETLTGHPDAIAAVRPVQYGQVTLLLSISDSGTVRKWDISSKPARLIATMTVPDARVRGCEMVNIAVDATLVGSAGKRLFSIKISDVKLTWLHRDSFDRNFTVLTTVSSSESVIIVGASTDGQIAKYRLVGERLPSLDVRQAATPGAICAGVVKRRDVYALGTNSGAVIFCDALTGAISDVLDAPSADSGISAMVTIINEGEDLLATGHRYGGLSVINLSNGSCVLRISKAHKGPTLGVAFVHIKGVLCVASAGADGALYLWRASDGTLLKWLQLGHLAPVTALHLIAVGRQVICLSGDQRGEVRRTFLNGFVRRGVVGRSTSRIKHVTLGLGYWSYSTADQTFIGRVDAKGLRSAAPVRGTLNKVVFGHGGLLCGYDGSIAFVGTTDGTDTALTGRIDVASEVSSVLLDRDRLLISTEHGLACISLDNLPPGVQIT